MPGSPLRSGSGAGRGSPPAQLMMASVLQFCEDVTDRQAAEALRDRITWNYALGVELEDPGCDARVLSELRSRLVAGELTSVALDALLARLAGFGLVKAGGGQRTDSTPVLGAIRAVNRLEWAGGDPACGVGGAGGRGAGLADRRGRGVLAAEVGRADRQARLSRKVRTSAKP
jgi:hypothetical protein